MDTMLAIFFVVLMVFSSIANKLKEKKELERRKGARGDRQGNGNTSGPTRRVTSNRPTGTEQVRTARPKGAGSATRTRESVAPGKQLLETLLGELNQDSDDWVPIEPKARRELPTPPIERAHEPHSHGNVREQAKAERERHEREVAKRLQRSSPPPVPAGRVDSGDEDPRREKRREEILAERERRKQARREQQQQSQQAARQRSSQSRRQKQTSAPVAKTRYSQWLHSKDTVRNAIVLAEILGPPKSFREDDQRIV